MTVIDIWSYAFLFFCGVFVGAGLFTAELAAVLWGLVFLSAGVAL